jgi:hypothetical protein
LGPLAGGRRQAVSLSGMTEPTQRDIRELVRRLETDAYSVNDIREAGELLAAGMAPEEAYRLALEFWESAHGQVRTLGLCMMRALAPAHAGARGFMAGAQHALAALEAKPAAPDYSAIGEVIKLWMREHRRQRKEGR